MAPLPAGLLAGATALGAAAVGAWAGRRAIRRRFESADRGIPGGVLPGAEPLALDGAGRGVLLLHGFGDTPQSLRFLAMRLHRDGWALRVPRLPGHGASLADLSAGRASDWMEEAQRALGDLQRVVPRVAVIGQSMGGALATILAAAQSIDALVLLAPYLTMSPRAQTVARFHRLITPVVPYLRSRSESSILDPEARRHALGRGVTTPRLLHELSTVVGAAWRSAPLARVPTLVIHSRRDPRIRTAAAELGFARLGGQPKALEWAERSGHVLSVDHDREWVAERVAGWLGAHVRTA